MIGVLYKKDQNWFIKYESIKDKTIHDIELFEDEVPYLSDSDDNTTVVFDIIKVYLYNETLYRGKLVQRIGELELLEKDMSILLDSIENPREPNINLKETFKKYKNKISDKEWDEIYDEYSTDNYPPFGGPFNDAMSLIDWLKLYFNPPTRKD